MPKSVDLINKLKLSRWFFVQAAILVIFSLVTVSVVLYNSPRSWLGNRRFVDNFREINGGEESPGSIGQGAR